jgi:hypothetical protein
MSVIKQLHFVVCVDIEETPDGTPIVARAYLDDETLQAHFPDGEVFLPSADKWESMFEHHKEYEQAQEQVWNCLVKIGE